MRLFQVFFPTEVVSRSRQGFSFAALTTPVQDMKSSLTTIIFSMLVCADSWGNLAIISRLGTGSWVFVILGMRGRTCLWAKLARLDCGKPFWIPTQLRHLIRS